MDESRSEGARGGRPGLCRNCGAITGPGENSCHVCGAVVGAPVRVAPQQQQPQRQAQPRYDADTVRFARAVLTRPANFTFVFLAVNVFVFALMYMSGGTENDAVFRAYGAKYNTLIDQGEWWRFVTPVFIHVNGIHLAVNMYSLFMLGPYVERLYGSARFVFFWVVTGVAGVAASYFASGIGEQSGLLGRFLFRGDNASAGASGALFGLIGVLFVFGIKFRHELPEGFKRAFGLGMLPTILINLAIGYAIPFIDNAAHVGGFVAGAALAAVVGYKRPGQKAAVAFAWHALQIAALALVVVGFGEVARHFDGPAPSLSRQSAARLAGAQQPVELFIEAHNEGQAAFTKAIDEGDADAADRALEKLERAPALDGRSSQLRVELKALVERARDFARRPEQERAAREGQGARAKLVEDFEDWERRADDWVKTEGEKFGIGLSEEPSPEATNEQPQRQGEPGPDAGGRAGGGEK